MPFGVSAPESKSPLPTKDEFLEIPSDRMSGESSEEWSAVKLSMYSLLLA